MSLFGPMEEEDITKSGLSNDEVAVMLPDDKFSLDKEKPVIEWVDIIHGVIKKKMQASRQTLAAHKGIMEAEWPENEQAVYLLDSTDVEACLRGVGTADNMVMAGTGTSDPTMNTQIMDMLQALVIEAKMDENSAKPNPVLVKIRGTAEATPSQASETKLAVNMEVRVMDTTDLMMAYQRPCLLGQAEMEATTQEPPDKTNQDATCEGVATGEAPNMIEIIRGNIPKI